MKNLLVHFSHIIHYSFEPFKGSGLSCNPVEMSAASSIRSLLDAAAGCGKAEAVTANFRPAGFHRQILTRFRDTQNLE